MVQAQSSIRRTAGILAVAAAALLVTTAASAQAGDVAKCASIGDDVARLRCYDQATGRSVAPAEPDGAVHVSQMSKRWELEEASTTPTFTVRPHKQNYMLFGRYSDNLNQAPYVPAGFDPNSVEFLDATEVKFQMSLKLKLVDDLFGGPGDLWAGYTQQNQWQLYNDKISAPFRETNYQPEIMYTIPTDYGILGLRGRMVTFGFEHQSNGRSEALSRSWNRVYAQVGFERGNFAMTIRPWYRLEEDEEDDDNPDITDYMGHGDVVMQYRHGQQVFSVMGRGNISEGRGFGQGDYSFPVYGAMRAYVQATSGYGESLIDYDHDQNTIGVGVLLSDWF